MGRKDKAFLKLGVCEKNADRTVMSQNEICRRICGERVGKRCEDGCMSGYTGETGFKIVEHLHPNAPAVDAVVINSGETITTLLYDKSIDLEHQLEVLKSYSLSQAELGIARMVLQGFSNREIATSLFISKPTLRTHLNNIYKKIPAEIKELLLRRRG